MDVVADGSGRVGVGPVAAAVDAGAGDGSWGFCLIPAVFLPDWSK